jgi:hypothetical protein
MDGIVKPDVALGSRPNCLGVVRVHHRDIDIVLAGGAARVHLPIRQDGVGVGVGGIFHPKNTEKMASSACCGCANSY